MEQLKCILEDLGELFGHLLCIAAIIVGFWSLGYLFDWLLKIHP